MSPGPRTVGVIVPVHDRAGVVAEAIRSVLAQTHRDLQVHVVDDGSTDGTAEVLDRLAETDARIHVTHQPNAGPAAARNRALADLDTPWVAFCDSDDLMAPDALEHLFAWLDHHPDHDGVFGRVRSEVPDGIPVPPVVAAEIAAADRSHVFQTVLIRRECLVAVGGYDETRRVGEDTDLYARLLAGGTRIGKVDHVLLVRRVLGDNISYENWDPTAVMFDIARRDIARRRAPDTEG